jgi:hypothetical protein
MLQGSISLREPSSACTTLLNARHYKHSPHAISLDVCYAWKLSASLTTVYAVRLPPIKFTCRRPRWRSTKEENTTFRHVSASAETRTKSCLPDVRFRWTLHVFFFGRAPAESCHRRRQLRTPLFR